VLPRLRSQPGARIVPKVPAAIARMTYAEYLAFEAQSDARHELHADRILGKPEFIGANDLWFLIAERSD